MSRKKTAADLKQKAVELMRAGGTPEDAAKETGIGVTTIRTQWRKWAAESGVEVKETRVRPETVPLEVREKVVQMRMQGVSNVRVAVETGLSESAIQAHWRHWAVGLGITPPATKHREGKDDGLIILKAKRRAVLLKNQSWRTKAVAAETGLDEREIETEWRRWGKEFGIPIQPQRPKEEPPRNGEVVTYWVKPERAGK